MPVMFWIHGGGLTAGAGSDYDPTPLLAPQNVIVVTINYRLGYLGFLAQTALDSEGHDAGNYGLMDQQFAMQWVQNNIAAFGGDPSNVTIFGESAGRPKRLLPTCVTHRGRFVRAGDRRKRLLRNVRELSN